MNRPAASLVVLAAAFAPAACKSSGASASTDPPKASTGDFEGKEKIRFRDEGTPASSSSGGSNAVGWVMAPFENVLYLPWKLVGGGVKGAVDGVSAGFQKDRLPILGTLFSPVNAILGLGTGMVEGVAGSPGLVGPDDNFGNAMSQPTKHATTIWWYQ